MTDLKISEMTAATTPLDGTEILPIVQGGANRKVAVSDLTVGRSVTALSYVATGSTVVTNGMYLPAANTVGWATNSTLRGQVSTTAFSFGLNTIVGSTSVAPDGTLHVHTATAGTVTPSVNADDCVVETSGNGGITVLTPDASSGALYFGSPTNNAGAYIYHNYDAGEMVVSTNKVGASLILRGGAAIANLTLSGASGSELTAAAGSVSIAKFLRLPTAGELTIAAGVVTAAGSFHTVDTQSDDPTDDLDTINGGTAGNMLIISAADSARTVVAKDGTGNLLLAGDFTMDNASDTLTLRYDGTNWVELSRSDNGA